MKPQMKPKGNLISVHVSPLTAGAPKLRVAFDSESLVDEFAEYCAKLFGYDLDAYPHVYKDGPLEVSRHKSLAAAGIVDGDSLLLVVTRSSC